MTMNTKGLKVPIGIFIVGIIFLLGFVLSISYTSSFKERSIDRINSPAPGIVCIESCAREDHNYPSNTIRVFRDENRGVLCYKEVGIGTNSDLTCVPVLPYYEVDIDTGG